LLKIDGIYVNELMQVLIPPVRLGMRRAHRNPYPEVTPPDTASITAAFADIAPFSIALIVAGSYEHGCFAHYLISM